jgi:ABC-type Na+ transport system ATPase subunit NatA
MRYKSFRIRNFKGIKDTTVHLRSDAGAAVFAFVGLNESGKTTILEAIHSFSPDDATSQLLGGAKDTGLPFRDRVPRHLIAEFSGEISVVATIELSQDDKVTVADDLQSSNIIVEVDDIPNELIFERYQSFKDDDYIGNYLRLVTPINIKSKGQRKARSPNDKEAETIKWSFYVLTPDIAYFPTFVFDFPESFFLTEKGDEIDQFYRTVFQDILDYDGRGHTIEKDIVRRVRREEMQTPWQAFWAAWSKHDDRDKIQHVMDRAGAAVTRLVFGQWNKIFGEDTKGKEVVLTFEVIEGKKKNEVGQTILTNQHDVTTSFQIRDGTRRFNVDDRSLGFRWFFSFMLFTQFRVSGASNERPVLFLFDEPASNLHAAAQQRLIESFPSIAKDGHVLAYSTHSHYMIEPKWLEQTFIVSNNADDPNSSVIDGASLDDESLDVRVSTYRSFVEGNSNQTSYFQPILDRLEVVPSRFDLDRPSVVLEGKSDYYILRYASKMLSKSELPLLPGLGAGTLGALAALSVGWNLNFLFVFDSDKAGDREKERHKEEFGIVEQRLLSIGDLSAGTKAIESLLDDEALAHISSAMSLTTKPTKNQIRRFFQERLASEAVESLGEGFAAQSAHVLNELQSRMTALTAR